LEIAIIRSTAVIFKPTGIIALAARAQTAREVIVAPRIRV
jgi:hypothetical protein